MKKIFLFALPAMMLFACGNKTQNAAPAADTTATDTVADTTAVQAPVADPTAEVKDAASAVYDDVAKGKSMDDLINKYGSADFKKSLKAYNKAMDGAEIGEIDYDIFLQAQDFDQFSYEIKSVEMDGDNAATAKVSMKNCGQKSSVTLKMVKEEGNWVVDDVIGNAGDAKKVMKANS